MIPRIRSVKPELFKHGALYDGEAETGLPLRLAFIALFSMCDREGRFQWRPRELKLDCMPYDNVDFSRVLDALLTRGFLVKYRVADDYFGAIPSWKRHQSVNNRESHSVLPDVSIAEEIIDASGTRDSRDEHASSLNRTEQNRTYRRVDDAKSGFQHPSIDEIATYCTERKNTVSAEAFFNHYQSNGWRIGKTPMANWQAAVRTWELSAHNGHPIVTPPSDDKWRFEDPLHSESKPEGLKL